LWDDPRVNRARCVVTGPLFWADDADDDADGTGYDRCGCVSGSNSIANDRG
jgi:hypothetical protein